MQNYLKPESKLKIEEKQDMLKMRTRIIDVKENMKGTHIKFHCEACPLEGIETKETQKHVYKCKHFNTKVRRIKYKEIFGSKISKMKKIVKRMKERTTKC